MLPINTSRLRQESALLFFQGELQQGHQLIKQCIELQPKQSHHHVNKSIFEYAMGNTKTALNDLHKAITLDHLNYQAYFNIFSIQMQTEQYEAAFKNLCCCMSVLHLLKAEKEEDLQDIEKAIEFSFNNKEARLFKSILKMQEKKNIQALNQINYAVYLDPSHSSLKTVQEKVYKTMGMKELTNKGPLQKPKYDRLETNKEIPAGNKIKAEIEKLLREFNILLKAVDTDQLYKVTLPKNEAVKPKETPVEVAKALKPKLYIAQTRTIQQQCEESNFISDTSYKFKEEKPSTANNSQHIDFSIEQNNWQLNNKNEPFFLFETSFSNLSVSDIGQNSKIEAHHLFNGQMQNEMD